MIGSIYIHIPFCTRKCIYCDFLSIRHDQYIAGDYVTALINELDIRKEAAGVIKTIYIGGGTPTTLTTQELIRLIQALRTSFIIMPDAEITIEANPGTIDREKISALAVAGVNRLSLGIQSFIDRELQLLGRIHNSDDAVKAIDIVRSSGISNPSLDLIYGIPGQTLKDWEYNISVAIGHSPEHISTYELTPEKETPLYDAIIKNKLAKPDEETIINMYYYAIDSLTHAGHNHYEISNFAKEGFKCRHNLNYWNRGEYIGIGAGAHSFIKDRRIRNTNDIEKYIKSLHNKLLAIEEDIEISCEDALKEFIFLGLRKTEGLNIKEFMEDLCIDLEPAAQELIENKLLESSGRFLRLTRKGIIVSNMVITELMAKLYL